MKIDLILGPDGVHYYYFQNLRNNIDVACNHQDKIGLVIVWGPVSTKGKTDLVIVSEKMDSTVYIDILEMQLLEYVWLLESGKFHFQQYIAPYLKNCKKWINDKHHRKSIGCNGQGSNFRTF